MKKTKMPLDLEHFTLCKVKKESEGHYFKQGAYCYFNGEIRTDEESGEFLYSMIGKVDGFTVRQWLEQDDFLIFKTFKQWSN